jgi:hypothetical protein
MSKTEPVGTVITTVDITAERDEGRLGVFTDDLDRVHLFQDRRGKWRWRRRAAGNFQTIASPQQGYADHDFCLTMALRCNAAPFLLTDAGRSRKVFLVEAYALAKVTK